MPVRSSKAVWEGTIGEGKGTMTVGEDWFEGSFNVPSRFEEGEGTNPEELIGAAHAGCFSMALSSGLTNAGNPPTRISTEAKVHVTQGDDRRDITLIELHTEAEVPGIDEAAFMEHAEAAKKNCPVSKALSGVNEITLTAKLV